jgi:drug/metabolite transporter (DMT)-like permease
MISGAIEYALTAGLFAYGVAWTTAGNAALINATEPVIIALLAVVFLREPLSARLIGVIACVTAGLLLVMSNELRTTGSLRAGDLMVLAAALSGATYAILSRQLVSSIDPLPLAWAQQLWGLAALLLLAAIASAFDIELFSVTHASDRSRAIASALGSGILGHAAAVWLHLHALRRMPASAFAVFLGMVPVFTFAGAYVLLDEVVSMTQFIGGALVITAALGAAGVYRTSPIHKGATG